MSLEKEVKKLFIVRKEILKLISNNEKDLIKNIRENQGDLEINNLEIDRILNKIFYK